MTSTTAGATLPARAGTIVRVAAAGAPLLSALEIWALSLSQIDLHGLDDYGLAPHLPVAWYLALGVCVGGTVWHAWSGSSRWAWIYLLGVVAVLFATLPLVASQPHYTWVYKHIGVVRFLEEHHRTAPIDIYNRWPGFFALSAVFGKAAGVPNPVAYAAWSDLFFTTLNLLFVGSIVRALTGSRRIAVAAGLLFVTTNWVGQTYFSPQALTFFLHLAVIWLVVTQLGHEVPGRGGQLALRLLSRVTGRAQDPILPIGHRWIPAWAAVFAVIGIDAALVASHQLTPYMLVLEVGALTLLDLVRPRLLVLGLLVLALAYLAPNVDYINQHFGLFTSLDPFSNAKHSALYDVAPMPGKIFNARAGQALTILMLGGAALSMFVLARRGRGTPALVLLVLAGAPFATVFGQNYGGEASLRIVLFASPWCAALVASAILGGTSPRGRGSLVALSGIALVASALFLPAYFGQEELHTVPRGEVVASERLYTEGKPNTVIMLSGPNFPIRYGARYAEFRGPGSDDDPNLLRTSRFRSRPLGPTDVPDVVSTMEQYTPTGYLVFSTTQQEYADVFRLTAPGALRSLETAVGRHKRFRLWYRNSSTRIYELLPRSTKPRAT